MNHEDKGEIAEADRVLSCNRRRVSFRCDLANVKYFNEDFDKKPEAHFIVNGKEKNGQKQKQQSLECTHDNDHDHDNGNREKLGDTDREKSSYKIVGILRTCSMYPSALDSPTVTPAAPRFKLSKLSKAMIRSNETRGCIEKLKKHFFHSLEHEYEQREPPPPHPHLKQCIENGERELSSLVRQRRRMVCLQNTKAMMGQTLPPTMMPFVEEALRAAHFLRRRRKENGHGRIIHQILIEQHKRVLKELEHNENRNGDTSHSSRQSHKSESS